MTTMLMKVVTIIIIIFTSITCQLNNAIAHYKTGTIYAGYN